MSYNFEYLKKKEQKKEPIGKWRGKEVHPISFNNLKGLISNKKDNSSYYYCVYDDNNYLINKGNVEGRLFEDGNIDTVAPRVWQPAVAKSKPATVVEKPGAAVIIYESSSTSGNVELNVANIIADVDKLLASACSWTVGAEV